MVKIYTINNNFIVYLHIINLKNKDMLRRCTKCEEEKEFSEFNYSKNGKNNLRSVCKSCESAQHRIHRLNNLEYYSNLARKRRAEKREEVNSWDRVYRDSYLKTLKGYSGKLFSNAKRRAELKKMEFNLTSNWVLEKLTPLTCDVTGLNLEIKMSKFYRINPLQPTLDRIDNTKGYTTDNVRVVCWWWNVMKQDWTDEVVKDLIKQYLENTKNE